MKTSPRLWPIWKRESCTSETVFDIPGKEVEIGQLDLLSQKEDFWNDAETAREVLKKKTKLSSAFDNWKRLKQALDDVAVLYDLASEEKDEEILKEVDSDLEKLRSAVRSEELRLMLGAEQDALNAIMNINAGAGGTEAQDWARFSCACTCDGQSAGGLRPRSIDYQPGEEAGVKSVTFTVKGEYAYGYLKAESGIHRLVRISPFDAGKRRHTSFASVFVYPEIRKTSWSKSTKMTCGSTPSGPRGPAASMSIRPIQPYGSPICPREL